MAKLTLDLTGKKGLAKNFFGDVNRTVSTPNLRYKAIEGQMAEGIYNPIIRNGYLSPLNGTIIDMETPTLSREFSCSHVDPENRKIFFSERTSARFYQSDSIVTDVSFNTYVYDAFDVVKFSQVFNHNELTSDIEKYQINGVDKMFYTSYSNMGIANTTNFASNDNDWLSTIPSGAFSMNNVADGYGPFMRLADNGFMYIFDSYSVHKVDGTITGGTNGTVTKDVIRFPTNFKVMDAIDYKGTMLMAINTKPFDINIVNRNVHNNFVGVYIWDRLSTIAKTRDFIPLSDVKEIRRIYIAPNGSVRVLVVANNTLVQIRELSSGNVFKTIAEFPNGATLMVPDGLTIVENLTVWAGKDGWLYGHGSIENEPEGVFKFVNFAPEGLYDLAGGPVLAYAGGSSFAAASGFSNVRTSLYIAYRPLTGNSKIKKWYLHGTGTITDTSGTTVPGSAYVSPVDLKAVQGDVYTPVLFLPTLSTLNHLEIFCAPTATGTDTIATIKVYANQSTTAFKTLAVTKNMASRGYVSIPLNKPYSNAIQVEIEWDTNKIIGVDDFCPSIGVLEYTPTRQSAKSKAN